MIVRLTKDLVAAIGEDTLVKKYGMDEHHFRYGTKVVEVDLTNRSPKQVEALIKLVEPHERIRGAGTLLKDARQWLAALGGANTRARTVEHFSSLVTLLLQKVPGHRVYVKDDSREVWQAYYVNNITYHPPEKKSKWETYPPYVVIGLRWTEFGGRRARSYTFNPEDCVHLTPAEALARAGLLIETDDLRKEYERRKALFEDWVEKLGLQFTATGVATDDLDGNQSKNDSWWYRRTNTIVLDKSGEPARVVIDVFREDDKEEREDRETSVDRAFWHRAAAETDDDDDEESAIDYDQVPEPEIPLHPMLACFDLRRHLRLRIDVGQLTPYRYDRHLGEKLVLPDDERTLVEMLLAHRGGWNDIISGKSGGSIILCAGKPGTGKTLTSEVYAEVMERPLYSVQASQLGTTPDDLESELLKCFARAQRWNAIMLLDEADVYVAARGSDLQQNAIVGVFLRVLEYYKGVLFLTTNRADLVDDAIASRCIARIDYAAPTVENQKRIWRILADTAGVSLPQAVIDLMAGRHPKLTGRDIKNLLKLARLVSESRKEPVTLDTLEFVKRFKPTNGNVD